MKLNLTLLAFLLMSTVAIAVPNKDLQDLSARNLLELNKGRMLKKNYQRLNECIGIYERNLSNYRYCRQPLDGKAMSKWHRELKRDIIKAVKEFGFKPLG